MREPAVAGLFYPAAPGELAATVDALLAAASPGDGPGSPPGGSSGSSPAKNGALDAGAPAVRALVVPHAGYVYSGPVAATGYALLRAPGSPPARVVLLGPAHHVHLRGMACAEAALWRTPLGEVEVERAPGIPADDGPHADEHALEVQLPFLQRLVPGPFTIVPVAVGHTDPAQVADLLDELEVSMPALVVVSTDLSHYFDAPTATRLDRRTAEAVVALDVEAVGVQDACGAWALRGLLEHCRRHGRGMRLLDRRTSADTTGDPYRVVGYASFAVASQGP